VGTQKCLLRSGFVDRSALEDVVVVGVSGLEGRTFLGLCRKPALLFGIFWSHIPSAKELRGS
jgi:hypothetical protein